MTPDAADSIDPASAYVSSLPIGVELVPRTDFFDGDTFPLARDEEGRVSVRKLDPPVSAEPPRGGEDGPDTCVISQKPDSAHL